MTGTVIPPGRRRRRWRVFVLLGILLLLIAYVGVDLWSGHRVDVEIAALEKQYGSLDDPGVVPVPADDNRARVVRAATALTAFGSDTTSSAFATSFSRFTRLQAPAPVPADLRAFVEANREAIRLVGEARSRRRSNFEIDYPVASNQPPLLDIRTLSSAIYLAALMDLEAGRADAAASEITSGLAMSASLRQEPELIAQLIRIAVAFQQLEAVQRVVTASEPSKTALQELARWLAENRTPDPMQMGLLGEAKARHAMFTKMESGAGWLARIGRPVVRIAHVRYLQQMGALLDLQSGPRPRPAAPDLPAPSRWSLLDRFGAVPTRAIERAIETGDDFNNGLGATEVAVALRRFKLDHGNDPDDLSVLTPAYLARLPIDPYTGQPPVYARQDSGFTLHAQGGADPPPPSKQLLAWMVTK